MSHKRIVVKVGTSSLTYPNGRLQLGQIERLVRELSDLVNAGHEVILVTSGAIGAGMSRLSMTERPATIPEKQAVAAVGQGMLMQIYSKMFSEYSHVSAQVLLTAEDLQNRKRYLNCRNTLETLLQKQVIPVINENDSVAIDQIRVGDNDTLAALVATVVSADLLIILSDIDGVYEQDPRKNPKAELISVIEQIDERIQSVAGNRGSELGTGGMTTKFQAARIVRRSGIPMIIANGSCAGVITKAVNGESVGSLFLPETVKLASRKRWIAFYTHPHGKLVIDPGAVRALRDGKSLLPIGITAVCGRFAAGDLIQVVDSEKLEVAKGLTNYSSQDISAIKGKGTTQIQEFADPFPYCEVIHRDNLVIT